jgi:nucleoside-diphosphate-sugar epimerase
MVLGASSQIGWFAIPRLLSAGYRVLAVSRSAKPDGYPEFRQVTWMHPDRVAGDATAVVSLVSAGPMGLAAGLLGELPHLERAVVFSTTSVLIKKDSPDADERRQMRSITEQESQLRADCKQRGIRLCLLRPTLVYGCGQDQNISRLARWMRRHRWMPIAGAAAGLRQPVHADDLAEAAVRALERVHDLPPELQLAGGSTLAYRQMLETIAHALDRPLRLVRLPRSLFALLVQLLGWLPGLRGLSPAMVHRQNQDLVFDDRPARDLLGYAPRRFRPGSGDFQWPQPGYLDELAHRSERGDA